MRIILSLSGLQRTRIGEELLKRLIEVYPEGNELGRSFSFRMRLPADDPRMKTALALLRSEGFVPWKDDSRKREKNEFRLSRFREYDEHDLVEAPYLSLDAYVGSWTDGRTDDGVLKLNRDFLDTDIFESNAEIMEWMSNYIISDRVKGLLEESNLVGWRISPTQLWDGPEPDDPEYETDEWHKVGGKWWELWSDNILPPLNREKNSVTDYRENPIPPESDKSVGYIREIHEPGAPNVRDVEYHFKRSEFESMPPFDVAALHEKRGKWPSDRHLIVSHQFRDFLAKHDVKGAKYAPVRIDPD